MTAYVTYTRFKSKRYHRACALKKISIVVDLFVGWQLASYAVRVSTRVLPVYFIAREHSCADVGA